MIDREQLNRKPVKTDDSGNRPNPDPDSNKRRGQQTLRDMAQDGSKFRDGELTNDDEDDERDDWSDDDVPDKRLNEMVDTIKTE